MSDGLVQGPASYFSSVEKSIVEDWQDLMRSHDPAKHMDPLAVWKSEHGMGHDHANAIVAYTLAQD